MTPKEWFGVVTRTLGLWMVLQAALQSIALVAYLLGMHKFFVVEYAYPGESPMSFIMPLTAKIAAAVVCLRYADSIVEFAYPGRAGDTPADSSAE